MQKPLRDPRRHEQLQKLIEKLGLPESSSIQWSLLDTALTHPTFASDANYEQLEFVGDAVARLVTAEFLYKAYAGCSVGELSAIRSVLVSDRILAQLADRYGLERYLLVGASAAKDPRGRESRLADAFEALLAALYLSSQNLKLITPWLESHLLNLAEDVRADPAHQNYKAALQEETQSRYKMLPEYRIQDLGRDPAPGGSSALDAHRYKAEVWLKDQRLGQGSGRSIKLAEKAAAYAGFLRLQALGAGPQVQPISAIESLLFIKTDPRGKIPDRMD